MAATLVVETGSGLANSNAYLTLAEAQAIADARLHVSTWTSATADQRTVSLIWATRLLDTLVTWNGTKNSDTQALQWPRTGVTERNGWLIDNDVVPQWLKEAVFEFALRLLSEDRTSEADTLGFKYMKADVLEAEIDPRDRRSILPPSVAIIVAPYGSGGGGLRFARVARA